MKIERWVILGLVLLVGLLVVRPVVAPEVVKAEVPTRSCGLQFEPLTTTIRAPGADRQVLGKIVYDTCTGKIWGFPTLSSAPYPVDSTDPKPPTSHAIYLGRFAVEDTQQ